MAWAGPFSEVADVAAGCPVFEKVHFSCMEDQAFAEALDDFGRQQVVLAGMEAHICVVQTAASLLEAGYDVFVASDATAARSAASEDACLQRLSAAGVDIVTTEMVGFRVAWESGNTVIQKDATQGEIAFLRNWEKR